MASNSLAGKLKKGYEFADAIGMVFDYLGESTEVNRCLKEIGEKRKKALEKKRKDSESVRKHRTILTSWSEDDRYAGDKFYQKKLRECYDKSRKLHRAMGLP